MIPVKSANLLITNFQIVPLFLYLFLTFQDSTAQESVAQYRPMPWLPAIWKSEPPAGCPFQTSEEIVGVAFTRHYASYTDADTFYPSWASDDNMYCGWKRNHLGCLYDYVRI